MASFSSRQNQPTDVEFRSLDSIHNVPTNVGSPQSSSSFNLNSPSSSSTSELSHLHNFDSVTAGNNLDNLLENIEPSLTAQDVSSQTCVQSFQFQFSLLLSKNQQVR